MQKAFDVKFKVENTESNTFVNKENAQHRECVVAYLPIAKCIVKEEAESDEDNDECKLVTYKPLPHGDIKDESKVEDGCGNEVIAEMQVIKLALGTIIQFLVMMMLLCA